MINRKTDWRWVCFGLAALALACGLLRPAGSDEPPGRLVFEDDFSDPQGGWSRARAAGGETDYADGMYRILVSQPDTDIWARSGLEFTDASIQVKALKVGGERDNRFGVICRAVDDANFYTFLISSDGYWGIGKVSGSRYTLLGMDSLQPAEAILQGSATNLLRADCWGETLTLYVNGQKVGEAQDGEFTHGDVGLIAGSYAAANVDIRFDDFSVRGP